MSGRRKRSGQEFQVEISNPPVEDESGMDESAVTTMAEELTKASEKLVEVEFSYCENIKTIP